jgi:hypothetical protein
VVVPVEPAAECADVFPVGVGELDVDLGAAENGDGSADLARTAFHAVFRAALFGDPVV